ncbi:ATP-binding protein [Streptomyces griseorubiginosus]|uniref:ATP-binding protein n=1 Tax=Streptomyces griseorubiginosus TaxID=67304 RepID=UPI001AD635A7|nr:ATP-binding protein [Streptomyces griseorubiginosus]MBO4258982.1 ATP-binding protein [Streptomyces griseorubiginosus]
MNAEISTPASTPTAELTQRLSSTPRGARLARHLTAQQLHTWGFPHDSDLNDTAQHVVAELAANAVTHGRVPGRDFELRLLLRLSEDTLRIEVSDARGDRQLRFAADRDGEGGRGLVLVTLLAAAWGVTQRAVGKTVWAELPLKEPKSTPAVGSRRPCPRTPAPEG